MKRVRPYLLGLLLTALPVSAAERPAPPTPEQLAFFETKIRPVLVTHCYECHAEGAKIVQGGLRVDHRAGLLKGGDSGPAITPGKPGQEPAVERAAVRRNRDAAEGKIGPVGRQGFRNLDRDGGARSAPSG
jgi:hypothetical protein